MTDSKPPSYDPKLAALFLANLREEKRGIIPSYRQWKGLRDVRNVFMHDYPEHADERAEALTLAIDGARALLTVLDRIGNYAKERIGLCLPQDRPPR